MLFSAPLNQANYIALTSIRMLFAGAVCVFAFVIIYSSYFSGEGRWPHVSATVIGNENVDNGNLYIPTLQYTADNKIFTTQGMQAQSSPYPIGHTMEIAYNPSDPRDADVKQKTRFWLTLTAIGFAVTGCTIVARALKAFVAFRRSLLR